VEPTGDGVFRAGPGHGPDVALRGPAGRGVRGRVGGAGARRLRPPEQLMAVDRAVCTVASLRIGLPKLAAKRTSMLMTGQWSVLLAVPGFFKALLGIARPINYRLVCVCPSCWVVASPSVCRLRTQARIHCFGVGPDLRARLEGPGHQLGLLPRVPHWRRSVWLPRRPLRCGRVREQGFSGQQSALGVGLDHVSS